MAADIRPDRLACDLQAALDRQAALPIVEEVILPLAQRERADVFACLQHVPEQRRIPFFSFHG